MNPLTQLNWSDLGPRAIGAQLGNAIVILEDSGQFYNLSWTTGLSIGQASSAVRLALGLQEDSVPTETSFVSVARDGHSSRVSNGQTLPNMREIEQNPGIAAVFRLELPLGDLGSVAISFQEEAMLVGPGGERFEPTFALTSRRLGATCLKRLFETSAPEPLSGCYSEITSIEANTAKADGEALTAIS